MNRAWTAAAAVTAAALAGGVSPATAASERATAARAVTGKLLIAPQPEALLTRQPARVAVELPPGTSRLRVRVGGRDVSSRFRPDGGARRVAALTRRDGLRYGPNRVVATAERRGRRAVVHARTFVLARQRAGLVRARLRPGPVTSLSVQLARGATVVPAHFHQRGTLAKRLSVIHRKRSVRLWLNGRQVTRAVSRSRSTRWTASLSAAHGLRHGVNRLRMRVVEPATGRYAIVNRRFVVRRDLHLAAAGWDVTTRLGARVRLDGRRSRAARGAQPRQSWRVVAKPRGSRAVLRNAGSARPQLTPDLPGRYVVGLTVTGGAPHGTAARAAPSSADTVAVTVSPKSPLVPFHGLTSRDGHPGIQVGGTFYPNPSPDGHTSTQWLTLDRATLAPTKTGNSWFDGTADGDHGVSALTTALSGGSNDQLVILAHPPGTPDPPVQSRQVAAFNRAMTMIGVEAIDAARLAESEQKLVIAGMPYGGEGSGVYTHGGDANGLEGWLMVDATNRYRFQSERPTFDTSASSTPTTNAMALRDQRLDATLPAGATGGFQVAIVDPIDFVAVDRAVFATNGVAHPETGLQAMAKFLHDKASSRFHVAVQSIGRVAPPPKPADPYAPAVGRQAWTKVSTELAGYGANPHTFNTVDGSYALLAGSWLARSDVADSSSTVAIDPTTTPPKRETGTLSGRVSVQDDGNFKPVTVDTSDSLDLLLYDKVFRSPTPWPYTAGGEFPEQQDCRDPGTDVEAYEAALSYIAIELGLSDYAPDLRTAYVGRGESTWGDQRFDLGQLRYEPGNGFGKAEFCNLKAQLQQEFKWLNSTKTLFDSYEKAFNRSGAKQGVDLHTIGDNIRTAIAPDKSAEIGWSAGAFGANMMSAGLVLAPEPLVLAAWEAFVVAYELVREIVSAETGDPLGDEVDKKVGDLAGEVATHLFDTANTLDRLRAVINSDYGRLQSLGPVAESPGWTIDVPSTATNLTTAANASFSSALMPVAYGIQKLAPTQYNTDPTAANCFVMGYGHSFRGAPATAQQQWAGDFVGATDLWVVGRRSLRATQYAYPPAKLTDRIFRPVGQGGYGVRLARFAWEQYPAVSGAPPTDVAYCH